MQRAPKLLTVNDVMKIIPLSKPTVTKIVSSIPHVRAGRRLLVTESEISHWIAKNLKQPNQPDDKPKPVKRRPLPPDVIFNDRGLIPTRREQIEIDKRLSKELKK